MKLEMHIIQNYPPSCLNRDDTNSPKTCDFGGYRRARISSQCLKRAIRWHPDFRELKGHDGFGTRTKDAAPWERRLEANGVEKKLAQRVARALTVLEKETDDNPAGEESGKWRGGASRNRKKTKSEKPPLPGKTLLFVAEKEIDHLAQQIAQSLKATGLQPEEIKAEQVNAIVTSLSLEGVLPKAPDIALFGRMITGTLFSNVAAACQVAHAISTHRVSVEMDFFTAVDDLRPDEEGASAFLDVNEFHAPCLYRYSVVDMDLLARNLAGDRELARRTLRAFLRASVLSHPTARQNTYAAFTPPSLAMAVIREKGQPVQLSNAFAKPVHPHGQLGIIEASVRALAQHWNRLTRMYGGKDAPVTAVLSEIDLDLIEDAVDIRRGRVETLDALLDAVDAGTADWAGGEAGAKA